jgi:hypothetical protein
VETKVEEIADLLQYLSDDERAEILDILVANTQVWAPLPGPQTKAYECEADVLFYGGAAGGGKSDLLLGLSLTRHSRSIIFRREAPQLTGLIDRLTEMIGNRDGFNGQDKIWRLPERISDKGQIEFGSCPHPGDETRYQGRPHDLKGFDEITHFTEAQFRFLCGWKRTTKKSQRCRVVCTGNPPTDSDGEWVTRYFSPWLDPDHPNPAKPGEIRYFAMVDGKEIERSSGEAFVHNGERIRPDSRTFIMSKVQDNPFLMSTGYEQTLQALPEPLRSQMLHGNFMVGTDDDPLQVIPTEWVKRAQERWTEDGNHRIPMDSMGVDVARGGRDQTIITRRHADWYDIPMAYPGKNTPDGPAVAALALVAVRDAAPIHVDGIGVGASVYDHLAGNGLQTIAVIGSEKSASHDRSGLLTFKNKRAELWWMFREALDPQHGSRIQLPPGSDVRADLCALRWKLTPQGILIESKEDLAKRIGRSPDIGDAIIYASIKTEKRRNQQQSGIPQHLLDRINEGVGGRLSPMSR